MHATMLHRWTLSDLQKMHKLDFQHQALALTLHDAQQQGILQAFLVMIRDKPDCTKLQQAAGECPGYNPAMTRITDWRDLSGQDPGFYSMTMDCNEKDIILQVLYIDICRIHMQPILPLLLKGCALLSVPVRLQHSHSIMPMLC